MCHGIPNGPEPPVIGDPDPEPVLMGGIKIGECVAGYFGIFDSSNQCPDSVLSFTVEQLIDSEVFIRCFLPINDHFLQVVFHRCDSQHRRGRIGSVSDPFTLGGLIINVPSNDPKPVFPGGIEIIQNMSDDGGIIISGHCSFGTYFGRGGKKRVLFKVFAVAGGPLHSHGIIVVGNSGDVSGKRWWIKV